MYEPAKTRPARMAGHMTKYSELKIGDAVPHKPVRGILSARRLMRGGSPCSVWHPLRVIPGKEAAAIASLRLGGVYAFCPMDDRVRVRNGKRIEYQVPTVSQIIYAKFRYQPQWDVMQMRRIITGVMCVGERPVILPADTIRILQGLPTRAEQIAKAKEELMRVNAGDEVELINGPMAGFRVQVTGSKDGLVWWNMIASNGMPVAGESSRDGVTKIDVA